MCPGAPTVWWVTCIYTQHDILCIVSSLLFETKHLNLTTVTENKCFQTLRHLTTNILLYVYLCVPGQPAWYTWESQDTEKYPPLFNLLPLTLGGMVHIVGLTSLVISKVVSMIWHASCMCYKHGATYDSRVLFSSIQISKQKQNRTFCYNSWQVLTFSLAHTYKTNYATTLHSQTLQNIYGKLLATINIFNILIYLWKFLCVT